MLKRLHPLAKLVICLAWIGVSVFSFDLAFQVGSYILACLLLIIDARIRPFGVLALSLPFALFGFGFLTTSLLFNEEAGYAVRMAGEQGGADAATRAGRILFFRALACGMVSAVFALTTDAGAFIRSLMQHARLPPQVAFALLQAMHMAPDLAREFQMLRIARAMARGRRLRPIPTPPEILGLVVPLLAFAIRRASRAAIAMEARGLRPGRRRSYLHSQPFRRIDIAVAAMATILLGLAVSLPRLLPNPLFPPV